MSPALLVHAAWIAAVCVALCTIHSRNRKPSLSFHRRRGSSSSRSCASSSREISVNCAPVGDNGAATATACATPAAKVSPTPSDTPPKQEQAHDAVTVIDVGTHGPIGPVFPAPDPIPPRRSLSAKHFRLVAERLGRIRSMRRGSAAAEDRAEDDVFVGLSGDAPDNDDRGAVLWTKTIILGERCRVPTGEEAAMVRWKSYRPRQPRSVPVTRSNSFAGVGTCKRGADARY
ncbi:hypothetical protein PR202_gb05772 [Eleusine coracana subsp. coracana]|uniref:Secreted protein n=1 Tax=Eleusine coracana subsp. coracana TaxID=191504 RepID=A0AAV5E5F2_ELECO|nr:hypothetical protein QOZ80_1BG0071420 [Eleusine coracana subsp. coracana]GJN18598.1 hypothetical protein PR202_gb05772 [Eleusine coracana subsp. coracana]